jgi:phage anti-repressor protein
VTGKSSEQVPMDCYNASPTYETQPYFYCESWDETPNEDLEESISIEYNQHSSSMKRQESSQSVRQAFLKKKMLLNCLICLHYRKNYTKNMSQILQKNSMLLNTLMLEVIHETNYFATVLKLVYHIVLR